MIGFSLYRRWPAVLAVVLLAGLLVGTHPSSPGFGEGQEDDSNCLGLEAAVARALDRHPLVSMAEIQVDRARLEAEQAREQADAVPEEAVESYEVALLKYLQPLQAESQHRLARRRLRGTEDNLGLQVKVSYLSLALAREVETVAHEAVEMAGTRVALVRSSLEAGMATEADLLSAEAQLAEARARASEAETAATRAESVLRRLLDWDMDQPLKLEPALEYHRLTGVDVDHKVSLALGRRFEVVRASEMVRLAEKQLELAHQYPSGGFPDLSDLVGDIDLPFPWPDWGQGEADWERSEKYTIPLAELDYREAVLGWRLQREEVEYQVRDLHLAVEEAAWQVVSREKALEAAREEARVAELKYEAGLVTSADVSGAQLALTSAEVDRLNATYQHQLARLRFEHARSYGFTGEPQVDGGRDARP